MVSAKVQMRGSGQSSHFLRGHGHPVAATVVTAIGVGAAVYNFFSDQWKCEDCSHTFSGTSSSCSRCTGSSPNMYKLHCCKALVCETCLSEISAPSRTACEMCNKPLIRK